MRLIDVLVPLILLIIGLVILWILVLLYPEMLSFAIGFAVLLLIFIIASFCSGRYSRQDSSDRAYFFKR